MIDNNCTVITVLSLRKCASFALEQTNVLRKGNANQVKSLEESNVKVRSANLMGQHLFVIPAERLQSLNLETWHELRSNFINVMFILVYFGPFEGHNFLPTVAATSFSMPIPSTHSHTAGCL